MSQNQQPQVQVCVSPYLSAEDLPEGKPITIVIRGIEAPPKEEDRGGKKSRNDRKDRNERKVLLSRGPGKKGWILNATNQWSIALLLGTKDPAQWVGKRIQVRADIDVDVETGSDCACLRVAGSPDATPERSEAYQRAWASGNRKRGMLAKRVKRAYRLLVCPVETQHRDEPDNYDFGPPPDDGPDMGDEPMDGTPPAPPAQDQAQDQPDPEPFKPGKDPDDPDNY